MIALYRVLFGILAILILWCLWEEESIYSKITFAFLAMPFILRALAIK